MSRWLFRLMIGLSLHWFGATGNLIAADAETVFADALFKAGADAYRSGDYPAAAQAFRKSAGQQPAAGTYQNLGNAEWRCSNAGPAIVAWERSVWLDPRNAAAKGNLTFARKVSQLEGPNLVWYEVISTWLPASWWAWISGASFWVAVGMALFPTIFRRRRAGWHQAVAACAFMIFLLSLPAHVGVHSRARIGYVLQKDTPLRLTPTGEGQPVTRLASGEPIRWERSRGAYALVKTSRGRGWLAREQFALVCPAATPVPQAGGAPNS